MQAAPQVGRSGHFWPLAKLTHYRSVDGMASASFGRRGAARRLTPYGEDIRFHDLRHTHATILLTAGRPPHEVAHRLGHADAVITLKVYAKALRDRTDSLGDSFAAALGTGW